MTAKHVPSFLCILLVLALPRLGSGQGVLWEHLGPYTSSFSDAPVRVEPFAIALETFLAFDAQTGTFRSDDRGVTWRFLSAELTGTHVNDVIRHPSGALFAAVSFPIPEAIDAKLLRSLDGGHSWTISRERRGLNVYHTLAVDPDQQLLVAATDGLYRTSPDGSEWHDLKVDFPATLTSLSADTTGLILAVTNTGIIFRSADNGASWSDVASLGSGVSSILNISAGLLFAVTANQGVFRSEDRGQTWNPHNEGLPAQSIRSAGASAEAIYVATVTFDGTPSGVFRMRHNAVVWEAVGTDAPAVTPGTLAVDPAGNLVAASQGNLYRFPDEENEWRAIPVRPSRALTLLVADDDSIMTVAERISFFLLGHDESWQRLEPTQVRALVQIQTGEILAGAGVGIKRSFDGGLTWDDANVGLGGNRNVVSLAASPDTVAYAGTSTNGVYRSVDRGGNWRSVGLEGTVIQALLAESGGVVYAGTSTAGVFRSEDRGGEWMQLGLITHGVLSLARTRAGTLFAGTAGGGVLRSYDEGQSWQQVGLAELDIRALLVDFEDRVLAATPDGIFITNDEGQVWISLNPEGGEIEANDLALDSAGRLHAATDQGVIRATVPLDVARESDVIPKNFSLDQNYPNPFNPSTTILLTLQHHAEVSLTVYDLQGRKVAELFKGPMNPGKHRRVWNAGALPSGVYLCRMEVNGLVLTRKLILLK